MGTRVLDRLKFRGVSLDVQPAAGALTAVIATMT
jgi:hypothetical protein